MKLVSLFGELGANTNNIIYLSHNCDIYFIGRYNKEKGKRRRYLYSEGVCGWSSGTKR